MQELYHQTAADDAIVFLRKNALDSEQFPSLENMTAGGSSRPPDLNSALKTIEELGSKFSKMREKFESFSNYISSLEARVRHMEQVASTYREASEDLRNKVSMLIDHADYYHTKDDFVQAVKYLIRPENSFTKEKKISSLLNREDTSPDLDLMINNLRTQNKPSSILELRVEMMKDPTFEEQDSVEMYRKKSNSPTKVSELLLKKPTENLLLSNHSSTSCKATPGQSCSPLP